jgi:hypothetical protein
MQKETCLIWIILILIIIAITSFGEKAQLIRYSNGYGLDGLGFGVQVRVGNLHFVQIKFGNSAASCPVFSRNFREI